MPLEPALRPIEPERFDALWRLLAIAMHDPRRASWQEQTRAIFEFDRSVGAFEGDELVGSAAALTQRLTVPGGEVNCAGITTVAVLPTHRRRGLLTKMLTGVLAQARERGDPVAALWASEATIYGRFGFGIAAKNQDLRIDLRRPVAFARGPGRVPVRLADVEDAPPDHLRAAFDGVRAQRPGVTSRSDAWWRNVLSDPEDAREDYGAKRVALVDDGYAIYRVKEQESGVTGQVWELFAPTAQAYAGLWRFLCEIDLLTSVEAPMRPLDEPLPLLLADARAVTVSSVYDSLWLRLLDVPAALEARAWAAEVSIALEVRDERMLDNSGVWALEAGPHGARCSRTDRPPDLVLDVHDLAAVYLGRLPVAALVAVGVAEERASGAADRLDAALRVPRAPWAPESF